MTCCSIEKWRTEPVQPMRRSTEVVWMIVAVTLIAIASISLVYRGLWIPIGGFTFGSLILLSEFFYRLRLSLSLYQEPPQRRILLRASESSRCVVDVTDALESSTFTYDSSSGSEESYSD